MLRKLLYLYIIPLLVNGYHGNGYELKQVIVLSRHNIRAPITNILELNSPKKWNEFDVELGYLTAKGQILEQAMGKYFFDWMSKEDLLDKNNLNDEVYVYSNNVQRTIETAKSFVKGAFNDSVDVYYNNETSYDLVFLPIIKNTSETYLETVLDNIKMAINNTDLTNAYTKLNAVVGFNNATFCETEHMCDLSNEETNVTIVVYNVPQISGALSSGHDLVDELLMSFYDGRLGEEWGLTNTEQWGEIPRIYNTFLEVSYSTDPADKDQASTLIEYLVDTFNGTKKFYLVVGHDANILTLTSALKFKNYTLDGQLEKAPIGGKVVFEKWYDGANERDLLRMRYVYQSSQQIKDGAEVSLQNPPKAALLEIEDCPADQNGFCPWDVFISILNNALA